MPTLWIPMIMVHQWEHLFLSWRCLITVNYPNAMSSWGRIRIELWLSSKSSRERKFLWTMGIEPLKSIWSVTEWFLLKTAKRKIRRFKWKRWKFHRKEQKKEGLRKKERSWSRGTKNRDRKGINLRILQKCNPFFQTIWITDFILLFFSLSIISLFLVILLKSTQYDQIHCSYSSAI